MTDITREILPDMLYTPDETAKILGLQNTRSVYNISKEDLPRTRTGPKGGVSMFRGRVILDYIEARTDGAGDDAA